MNILEKYPKLNEVLCKMCEYVDTSIDAIDLGDNNLFCKYEWTGEQQEEFVNWLADKIRKDKELREELWGADWKPSKQKAKKMARMFVFNLGWKVKTEV
jgi:hypothetical protein